MEEVEVFYKPEFDNEQMGQAKEAVLEGTPLEDIINILELKSDTQE